MGNRALIQFENGDEISPVIYLHWHGDAVRALLDKCNEYMEGRRGDVSYCAARFVGICHETIDGNLSLGIWNNEKRLTKEDSHGDAGCFVVNAASFDVDAFGGYGLSEPPGLDDGTPGRDDDKYIAHEPRAEYGEPHRCDPSERWELYDARGISCGYVCDKCEAEKRRQYRPEIFRDPGYYADEPIEPEPGVVSFDDESPTIPFKCCEEPERYKLRERPGKFSATSTTWEDRLFWRVLRMLRRLFETPKNDLPPRALAAWRRGYRWINYTDFATDREYHADRRRQELLDSDGDGFAKHPITGKRITNDDLFDLPDAMFFVDEVAEDSPDYISKLDGSGTNITTKHRELFNALRDPEIENLALFSCFVNGVPTSAIVSIHKAEDTIFDDEIDIVPHFVAITPEMSLKDHDDDEAKTLRETPERYAVAVDSEAVEKSRLHAMAALRHTVAACHWHGIDDVRIARIVRDALRDVRKPTFSLDTSDTLEEIIIDQADALTRSHVREDRPDYMKFPGSEGGRNLGAAILANKIANDPGLDDVQKIVEAILAAGFEIAEAIHYREAGKRFADAALSGASLDEALGAALGASVGKCGECGKLYDDNDPALDLCKTCSDWTVEAREESEEYKLPPRIVDHMRNNLSGVLDALESASLHLAGFEDACDSIDIELPFSARVEKARRELDEIALVFASFASVLEVKEDAPLYIRKPSGRYQVAEARAVIDRALALTNIERKDVIKSPDDTETFLKLKLGHLEHESFAIIYLDNRHRVIKYDELFRGTIDGTTVHPREVVKESLACNAAAIILAHNHPSGVAEPSAADERITKRLKDALSLVDIRVLDHLIIAGGGSSCTSLAKRGVL